MTNLTPRRLQTRERLLDAAVVVFAERGVGSATIEQISEQAGFTRGAFYSNFASWDDLCLAVLRRTGDRVRDSGDEALLRLTGQDSGPGSSMGMGMGTVPGPGSTVTDTVAGAGPAPGTGTGPGSIGDPIGLAIRTFVETLGHDAAQIHALMDLQLYAARRPALNQAFAEVRAETDRVLLDVLSSVLAVAGLRLTVEPGCALRALSAVYESTGIQCAMSSEEFAPTVTCVLTELLHGLLRTG